MYQNLDISLRTKDKILDKLLLNGIRTERLCPENADGWISVHLEKRSLLRRSGCGLVQLNIFINVSYEGLDGPLIKSEGTPRLRGKTNGLCNRIKIHKTINSLA